MNKGLKTALATIALAQFLKIPIKQLETGRWDGGSFLKRAECQAPTRQVFLL